MQAASTERVARGYGSWKRHKVNGSYQIHPGWVRPVSEPLRRVSPEGYFSSESASHRSQPLQQHNYNRYGSIKSPLIGSRVGSAGQRAIALRLFGPIRGD